jgi:hypothetical protein
LEARSGGVYARSTPNGDVFVGHGLLAFAGIAGVAALLGYRRERALALGVVLGVSSASRAKSSGTDRRLVADRPLIWPDERPPRADEPPVMIRSVPR